MRRLPAVLVVLLWAAPVAAQEVTYQPGQSISATCTGQWTQVVTSPKTITAACAPASPTGLRIIVGHAEVELFTQVPVSLVQPLRVMSANWSVGGNIHQGLQCLSTTTAAAPSRCRRWCWPDGTSHCSTPIAWTAHHLPGWSYFGFMESIIAPRLPCADRSSDLACFESYADAHAGSWDVMSMQPSYLHAGGMISAPAYLAMYERLQARHPQVTFVLHTSSLAAVVGWNQQAVTDFNTTIRAYAEANDWPLLDLADILSHTPAGQPFFYQGFPALPPVYTSETTGGHLGYPVMGQLRTAMGWWVVLAQIAGWTP